MDLLAPFKPDLAVTAGYMLIAPVLCTHYTMVNLHPALPDGPTGMVDRVIRELIDRRAPESGVMASIITEDVDRGPVLMFIEGGWVFGRKVEFRDHTPNFDIDNGTVELNREILGIGLSKTELGDLSEDP
jgi:hypothetical protein